MIISKLTILQFKERGLLPNMESSFMFFLFFAFVLHEYLIVLFSQMVKHALLVERKKKCMPQLFTE